MADNGNAHPVKLEKSQTASFTGHRIISGKEIWQLQHKTYEKIMELAGKGVLIYLSGGAIGYDTLAAQAVLKAREQNSNVKLVMLLPCSNQESRWNESDKKVYRYLLDNADQVIYVSEQPYFDGCMKLRNEYLIKHSGVCVAYIKRGRSGTSQTVRIARESGLTVINLAEKERREEKCMKDFEKAFGEFIDQKEYDVAEETILKATKEALFEIVRAAFKSGWIAAGGGEPEIAVNNAD